jgi:hypothetical protein
MPDNAHARLLASVENMTFLLLDEAAEDAQAILFANRALKRFRELRLDSMVSMVQDNLSSFYLVWCLTNTLK